ncbi:MAG TPA: hypothetical protein VGG28_23975 [Kofleriaceae bacterium]|jgi:hypothetical protein
MRTIAIALLASSSLVFGDTPHDPTNELLGILNTGGPANEPLKIAPRLVLDREVAVAPADYTTAVDQPIGDSLYAVAKQTTIAKSADGTASWVALDYDLQELCASEACAKHPPVDANGHMAALFDAAQPIAWDTATAGGKAARKLVAAPTTIVRRIDAGAEDADKLFEATLGDPAAFAKAISDRKDAVMFGSDPGERFVGGVAIRAQLAKWKLAFKLRDGVQAGVTSSKTIAFVAANVDAVKSGAKPAAYRVFAIYEKTNGAWRTVLLQFSNR